MNKILIIDDNEDDFIRIKRLVQGQYEAIYDDGTGAILDLIIKEQPDCILLDYNLGIVKGVDVLKEIKANKEIALVPVTMLTSEINPSVIIDCMKCGADDYFIKESIDKERVLISLGILIEKAALQRRVDNLEKLLPICAKCKKIRAESDDPFHKEAWEDIDRYLIRTTNTVLSHGYCPDCYDDFIKELDE